jgi:hypothetical protein
VSGPLFGVVVGRVVDGAGEGVVGVVERCGWGGRELLGADVSWFGLCEVLDGDGVVVVNGNRSVLVVDDENRAGTLNFTERASTRWTAPVTGRPPADLSAGTSRIVLPPSGAGTSEAETNGAPTTVGHPRRPGQPCPSGRTGAHRTRIVGENCDARRLVQADHVARGHESARLAASVLTADQAGVAQASKCPRRGVLADAESGGKATDVGPSHQVVTGGPSVEGDLFEHRPHHGIQSPAKTAGGGADEEAGRLASLSLLSGSWRAHPPLTLSWEPPAASRRTSPALGTRRLRPSVL